MLERGKHWTLRTYILWNGDKATYLYQCESRATVPMKPW